MFTKSLRTASSSAIATTSIAEIASELEVSEVRIVDHKKLGKSYLHLVLANGQYLSIRIGDKVVMEGQGLAQKVAHLFNTYTVFTGEGDNGRWFTFAPQGELVATESISFAEVLKAGEIKLQMA